MLGLGFVVALGGAPPAPSAEASATAPVSLTSSDGTGLRIVSLQARAVVEDPLAFTELHLVFRNDQPRTIEGQLAITLPPGAAVSRFATLQAWGWQEGEIVERQAARVAYESFLHRRVDPALLEKQAGNEFRARIFPIPASANKEIVISYSQELAQASQPYRLALRGLPRLDALDARVLVGKRVARPAKMTTTLGGAAVTQDIVEVRKRDFQPDVDLEVPLPSAGGGLRHDNLAVARVTPVADAAPDRPQDLLVLVDTSASRALGFAAEVERLRALIAQSAGELGRQIPLRVACFDQSVAAVYAGTLGGFGAKETRAILDRRALGASNLGRALDWAAAQKESGRAWTRLLIVTDGVATAGPVEGSELRAKVAALAKAGLQRLDVMAVGGIRDEPTLRALATGGLPRDGAVLDEALPAATVSRRLASATISGIKVAVPGAGWVWPERLDGVQPGDQVLVYADLPARRPFEVVLSGARTDRQELATVEAERPLLERAWVGARIQRLERQRDTLAAGDGDLRSALRREIVDLSVRHRVLADYTALLVLETEQDYARFNIDRRALTDILTVGPTGVDVLRRGDLPGGAFAGGTSLGEPFAGDPRARESTPVARAGASPPPLAGPARDRDGDRIPDDEDGCPDEPETYNGFDDVDGCPDQGLTVVRKARIVTMTPIYFETGKDIIKPGSFPVVDAIAAAINGNPWIEQVEIQGHTARGEKDRLATSRANAVIKALGQRNVDRTRLVAGAFGHTKPICTQKNQDCLSKNRRVEFIILNRDHKSELSERVPGPSDKPTPPAPPPPPPRAAPVPDQERRFAEATALLKAGKPQQARSAAQSWRDQRPADVLALLALGAAAEATGDLSLAARAYGSLIDLFPSQADERRLAGERLARLGGDALALAVDTLRQARAQRPDQPSSHRLLAYALVRAGQPAAALDVALEGVRQTYPTDRFAGVGPILREDAAIIAAAAIRQNPGARDDVVRRLAAAGIGLATGRSLRFVLSWETDASDVDLHVKDGKGGIAWFSQPKLESGGRLYADVTTGYGPECFAIDGAPAAYPYALSVTYYNRGPTGYGLGHVQVIEHDGAGRLRFDDRPFVLLENRGQQELGTVPGPLRGS
jgi:outer membrane protein OmpA-like peptidoglycan-associated protein